jgi:membrane protease YdiL (CAAX protease family)
MKKGTTLFLKLAVIFMGLPVLVLSVVGLIDLVRNPANPDYAYMLYPIVTGIYLSSLPYYFALYQSFRLLSFLDKGEAFSELSVVALRKIKYCGILISIIFMVLLPFVFMLAQIEDAPGLIIVGMIPVFTALVIGVFAAVLEKLLKEAIDIKSLNDLTV